MARGAALAAAVLLLGLPGPCRATFGNCDTDGYCDWNAYWRTTILHGLGAWIFAFIIICVAVIYFLAITISCCCRGCRRRPKDKPLRWSRHVRAANLTVIATVVVAAILALCGFTVALCGWFELDHMWDVIDALFNSYTNALRILANFLVTLLEYAQQVFDSIAGYTNNALYTFQIPTTEITNAFTNVNNTVDNVSNTLTAAQLLYNIYKWFMIPISLAVFVVVALLTGIAIVTKAPKWVLLILIFLGFLGDLVVWLSLGADQVGLQVARDMCAVLEDNFPPTNPSHTGALQAFGCNPNISRNNFTQVSDYVNAALNATAQAMCDAVRSPCSTSAFSCPTIPTNCTNFSATASLVGSITVSQSSSAGGCDSCTLPICATTCTNRTLQNASLVVVDAIQMGSNLTQALVSRINPVETCQALWDIFLEPFKTICGQLVDGLNLLQIGSILLGVAASIATICLIVMAEWFHGGQPRPTSTAEELGPPPPSATTQGKEDPTAELSKDPFEASNVAAPTPAATPSASPEDPLTDRTYY